MADADKTLKLLIDLGVNGQEDVEAAGGALKKIKIGTEDLGAETQKLLGIQKDTDKEMGVISVSQADVEAATRKTTDATKDATEKFGESRREIRMVGNELGRAAGVSGLGGLF